MLQSEIIYNTKNLLSGGVQSDDLNISNNQLAFIIDYYRAKLFKQREDRGTFDKQMYLQNLGHVELVLADKNECCEISDCILRTKFKVPKPIGESSISFVGLTNGKSFQKTNHNAIIYSMSDKYTGKKPKWYYENGYIYLVNPPTTNIETINIKGIFEKPALVNKFNNCKCEDDNCSNAFDSYDFEYPLPMHYVDSILKLISETELKLIVSLPRDLNNDSIDNVNSTSK
jgi:hypothetical protein